MEKIRRAFRARASVFSLFTLTVDTIIRMDLSHVAATVNVMTSTEGQPVVQRGQLQPENIAEFINKIKASPWFKDTVIVVSSDHLAMNNTARKYLNKQDRNNLFFVLRGDQLQQDTLAVKRNTMDNGATVLDILGGDNFIGLGRSSLSSESVSEVFLNIKEKMLAWEARYHSPVEFPEKDERVHRRPDKKYDLPSPAAISACHLLLRVSDKRVEPLPESEYWPRCASSWRISPAR